MRLPLEVIIERCDELSIPVTLARNDSDQFPLIHVNPAFVDLTGYELSDVKGQNCRFLQGKDTSVSVTEHIRQKLSRSESVCSIITNYRRSGTEFRNFLVIESLNSAEECPLFVGFQYEICDHTQIADLSRHIGRVAAAGRDLGKKEEIAQNHLLLAFRQRSDAALLTLKMLTSGQRNSN